MWLLFLRVSSCLFSAAPPSPEQLRGVWLCVSLGACVCVYTHPQPHEMHMHTYIYPPAPCLRLQFYRSGSNYCYNGTHPTEALQLFTVDSQPHFSSFKNIYTHIHLRVCVYIYVCSAVCLRFLIVIISLFSSSSYFLVPPGEAGGGRRDGVGGVCERSSPAVSVGCSGRCKSSLCDIKLDEKCEPAVFQCVLCVWTLLCRLRVRGLGTCRAPLFVFLQE